MGRKRVSPSQKKRGIAITLDPHTIKKLDEYCERFGGVRSKVIGMALNEFLRKRVRK